MSTKNARLCNKAIKRWEKSYGHKMTKEEEVMFVNGYTYGLYDIQVLIETQK